MNYLEARQVNPESARGDAGKWRFTCLNDDEIWTVGYCAHNCPGHDTPEEAAKHYYDYQIDTAVFRRFHLDERTKEQCEFPECKTFTQMMVRMGGYGFGHIVLCNRHHNKEGLRAARPFRGAFQVISS